VSVEDGEVLDSEHLVISPTAVQMLQLGVGVSGNDRQTDRVGIEPVCTSTCAIKALTS
jgi:hypothetical protein